MRGLDGTTAVFIGRVTDPLYGQAFDDIVSLGRDCRPAYQIALNNFRRTVPHFSEMDFKKVYWKSGAAAFPSGKFFFDTLIASFPAVIRCVRDEFEGVFDREQLTIGDKGFVTNRDGIVFMHDFSNIDGRTTGAILDKE